jgi:Pyruvate/2-oxoacid:ferredoxin oxidoreductase gamma subunit/Pyruvate/2-oxoacid:ferredoxin oxidoreductase delta subunit
MTAMERILARLSRGDAIDLRGHGKAGGGLVLALQAFGEALSAQPGLDVQDWPLFSSARKGANVCAYLRVARGSVEDGSRVTEPDIALLMNEAAAEDVDFAEGTHGALFVINTARSPGEAADRWRLAGTIVTVPGDALGREFLGRPLANVAVLAALVKATGLVTPEQTRASLEHRLEKRRVPRRIIDANLALFDAALGRSRTLERTSDAGTRHPATAFQGYGELPVGAQSRLRTSVVNRTASYGRPGVAVRFDDREGRCNACSLCVVQCPDDLILFTASDAGALVRGARFETYCKTCLECVAACPLHLFHEISTVAPPQDAAEKGG